MHKTVYECKVLTPMFLVGTNKNQPELRAASIKGVMRYFYRASMNYPDAKQLFEEEGKLFGCVNKRDGQQSGLRIQVQPLSPITIKDEPMLPHRKDPMPRMLQKAFVEETTFSVTLRSFGPHEKNHASYEALFELTALLGGFGRRSRRGFGSVMIEKKNKAVYPLEGGLTQAELLPHIFSLLENLSAGTFMSTSNAIERKKKPGNFEYPYIEKIILSAKKGDIPRGYGEAGHTAKQDAVNKGLTDSLLTGVVDYKYPETDKFGKAVTDRDGSPVIKTLRRYASPIYCSVALPKQGVITVLHSYTQRDKCPPGESVVDYIHIQKDFINAVDYIPIQKDFINNVLKK